MSAKARLLAQVFNAAETVSAFWPLKSFIATNPLAGFEETNFFDAVKQGTQLFGGQGLPTRQMGQKALKEGRIERQALETVLHKYKVEHLYKPMVHDTEVEDHSDQTAATSQLNAHFIKYLAAFLDEGQASWEMPHREKGFYTCWKTLAQQDSALPNRELVKQLPESSTEALLAMVKDVPEDQREQLFAQHFAAMPGWSGFVKWRAKHKTYPWQQAYPITLRAYLVVRLAMAKMLGEDGLRKVQPLDLMKIEEGKYWLEAWENTYRDKLFARLQQTHRAERSTQRPDAQFVFCIDVRSEVFRRHLEAAGKYETIGFAGFFGVPIAHTDFGSDLVADSCPVLLHPQYRTTDRPCAGHEDRAEKHLHGLQTLSGLGSTMAKLKKDMVAPYATVEALGAYFGLGMAARTFVPKTAKSWVKQFRQALAPKPHLEPIAKKTVESEFGLTLKQRVFHAEAALKIMGLTQNFAPFVFLAGHGSETVNNPYASGLDCGACGGNHGGPNARLMAAVFNDPEVRAELSQRNIEIPDDTLFIGAQHNTTTDDLEMFLSPDFDSNRLARIQRGLERAREASNCERMTTFSTKRNPDVRASDWAEVRPEWGLAGNAAFIVGSRAITQELDLGGRSFLHSYDWRADQDGKILEIILTAPMVVGQWINSQYYFSTVDNAVYGSGSKTTHNVVGKIGVMQGNASDLMTGLPLQSVMRADGDVYHEPLRLQTVVQAPVERLKKVISEQDVLKKLFHNEWVSLVVIDPMTGNFMRYHKDQTWQNLTTPFAQSGPSSSAAQASKAKKTFSTAV